MNGTDLKNYRVNSLHMTQEELAELLDVTVRTISATETRTTEISIILERALATIKPKLISQ